MIHCPYANLLMLKLLALFPEYTDGKDARIGAETLLELWDNSEERHPYMFFMGTDFRKLKAPFIVFFSFRKPATSVVGGETDRSSGPKTCP